MEIVSVQTAFRRFVGPMAFAQVSAARVRPLMETSGAE